MKQVTGAAEHGQSIVVIGSGRGAQTTRIGVLLAAVMLTITFVLLGKDSAGGPRLSGGEKPATPVAVSESPMWNSEQKLELHGVRGARLRGDTVVLVGTVRNWHARRLVVAGTDTGKERWSVETGRRLGEDGLVVDAVNGVDGTSRSLTWSQSNPLLTGEDGDWSVLVSYTVPKDPKRPRGGRVAQGVAALSGKDGHLLWKRELPGKVRLLTNGGGRGGTLLVGVRSGGKGEVTSYALDTRREGRTLWKYEGGWVFSLAGDTALGEHRGPPEEDAPYGDWNPYDSSSGAPGSVFAVDARTGAKKWDLERRHEVSSLRGAVDGRAVIHRTVDEDGSGSSSGRVETVVVDTETGKPSDHLDDGYSSCGTDGHGLLACLGSNGTPLLTIRAGPHHEPVIAPVEKLRRTAEQQVQSVRKGRVYVSASGRPFEGHLVLDRLGHILRGTLPGAVLDTSEGRAVVSDDKWRRFPARIHRIDAVRP